MKRFHNIDLAVILVFLNMLDCALTLTWFPHHPEGNPLMDMVLTEGVQFFVLVKLVTSAVMFFLVVLSDTKFTKLLLSFACVVYIFVNIMHFTVMM